MDSGVVSSLGSTASWASREGVVRFRSGVWAKASSNHLAWGLLSFVAWPFLWPGRKVSLTNLDS